MKIHFLSLRELLNRRERRDLIFKLLLLNHVKMDFMTNFKKIIYIGIFLLAEQTIFVDARRENVQVESREILFSIRVIRFQMLLELIAFIDDFFHPAKCFHQLKQS